MIFTDPIPADVQQQISAKVTLLSKVIWPALATLVPAAVTTGIKWAQDHSRNRRSAELIERITKLAKGISELPPPITFSGTSDVTPQSAFSVELESALRELTALQKRGAHSFAGITTITAKLRSGFLLYRPKGWAATLLHIAFFSYLFFFFFALIAGVTPDQTSNVTGAKSPSDFVYELLGYLTVFGILGIPPMILRHFAAKIHRRQCAQAQIANSTCEDTASEPPLQMAAAGK
jgi:hypothetical protein